MATQRVFYEVVNGNLNINYLNVKFKALNMKQTRNMFKERYCVYKYYWKGGGETNTGKKFPRNLLLDFM